MNYLAFAAKGSRYFSMYDVGEEEVRSSEAFPLADPGDEQLGVDAIAVTPNEEFVIIANALLNDMDFYSLPSLEKVKTYKGVYQIYLSICFSSSSPKIWDLVFLMLRLGKIVK